MDIIIILAACYTLGSLPFGLWIVLAWRGIDIREYGSGNIGATNVLRTAGKGPAIVVFLADVLKGLIPVIAARMILPESAWIIIGSGLAAIIGHTASPFLRFSGGKGVATGLGVIIGLSPSIAGIGFGVWIVLVALARYVSLASMTATATVAVLLIILDFPLPYKLFGIVAAAYSIIKHRSNILRLIQGKESRFGERVSTKGDSNGQGNKG